MVQMYGALVVRKPRSISQIVDPLFAYPLLDDAVVTELVGDNAVAATSSAVASECAIEGLDSLV